MNETQNKNNLLQLKIIEETHRWYEEACTIYNLNMNLVSDLKIDFNLKNSTAGIAYSIQNKIEYNLILASQNEDAFIKRTIPHEVMHLVANKIYKRNVGHKKEWAQVMTRLGLTPSRCHTYELKNLSRKFYKYNCGCNAPHEVGINLHKKMQAGDMRKCSICKEYLNFDSAID